MYVYVQLYWTSANCSTEQWNEFDNNYPRIQSSNGDAPQDQDTCTSNARYMYLNFFILLQQNEVIKENVCMVYESTTNLCEKENSMKQDPPPETL